MTLPPKLRWSLRLVRRIAFAFAGFLLLYALLALVLPRIPIHSDRRPPATGLQIFIASNGVHTDFVVPARTLLHDWSRELPPAWFERVDDSYEWLTFGWGDRGFYLETPTWSDLKPSTAAKAACFLGHAAMHVTWLWRAPQPSDVCRPLVVTDDEYRRLVAFLLASFVREADGRLAIIDHAGYTAQDRFFAAAGSYSFVHTCNAWTGDGLDAMGVKTGLWTPFAWDVMRWLEE